MENSTGKMASFFNKNISKTKKKEMEGETYTLREI